MTLLVAGLLALAVLVWPRGRGSGLVLSAPTATPDGACPEHPPGAADPEDPAPASVSPGEVATAVDLLALALGGGAGVAESVDVVADQIGGAPGGQLQVVAAALRWGLDDHSAWSQLPAVWAPAARAMTLAGLAGVPAAELLVAAAADLRRAEQARLEVAAARLGVTLVLPLGLAFLPAFVLLTVLPVVLALAQQVLGRA